MIIDAARFAKQCHAGQVRKYSGRPYITHPIRVAGRVATHPLATEPLVAAAFLHDVVEDCDVPLSAIETRFGPTVVSYVDQLTNPTWEDGIPRSERKRRDRDRIATISNECKMVKLIDRIDNLHEIDLTSDFARLYANESLLLLEVLLGIDGELESELRSIATSML